MHCPFPEVFRATGDCEQSHYDLTQLIKDRNLPYATIFEDDVIPTADIFPKTMLLSKALNDNLDKIAICNLGKVECHGWPPYMNKPNDKSVALNNLKFMINENTHSGAFAYWLNGNSVNERLESFKHQPSSIVYQYMKDLNLKYNYADRWCQEQFSKLDLICKSHLFGHHDIKKNKIIL